MAEYLNFANTVIKGESVQCTAVMNETVFLT